MNMYIRCAGKISRWIPSDAQLKMIELLYAHRVLFSVPDKYPWECTALVKEGPKAIVLVRP